MGGTRKAVRLGTRLAGVCAAVWLLSGCGVAHIRGLREAEDSFNRAAALENQQRLGDDTSVRGLGAAATGYRLAEQISDSLIREKSGKLREDNLLCTAYVIRAMSLWRLGNHLASVRVAEEGKSCAQGAAADAVPREMAVLHAVPGLARIDQANALVANNTHDPVEFTTVKTEAQAALGILQSADGRVPSDHPVRAYFFMSQLAAIRAWHSAVTSESLPMGNDPASEGNKELKESRGAAITALTAYRRHLKCDLRREDEPYVAMWKSVFAIEDTDLPSVPCR